MQIRLLTVMHKMQEVLDSNERKHRLGAFLVKSYEEKVGKSCADDLFDFAFLWQADSSR